MPTTVRMDIGDLTAAQRRLADQFPTAILAALESVTAFAEQELVAESNRLAFFNGQYSRGWTRDRASGSGARYRARVYNPTPYAPVIELGRRPGRAPPPADALRTWVQRVLAPPLDQLDRTVERVRWGIARKGTPAKRVMASVMDRIQDRVPRIFADELFAAMTRVTNERRRASMSRLKRDTKTGRYQKGGP